MFDDTKYLTFKSMFIFIFFNVFLFNFLDFTFFLEKLDFLKPRFFTKNPSPLGKTGSYPVQPWY